MATLVKDIEDIKKHVSVYESLEWDILKPYVVQADRKFLVPAIGQSLYDQYGTQPTDEVPLKVFNLLCEASSHLALFLYVPIGNVVINDHGIMVENTQYTKSAEWWQVRDVRRSFLEAGFSALDEAVRLMESNESQFVKWKESDSYTVFMELFVKRTDTFNRWFNIGNSRRSFLALRPHMLEVHHQYFVGKLGVETVARINFTTKPLTTLSTELAQGTPFKVMELLQASQVNYTIAKAIESGMFEVSPTGIYQKLDDFPGQRTKTLDEVQVNRLMQNKLIAGEEYYKKALALIESSPEDFPEYTAGETAKFVTPTNTKSTVSF